MLKVCGINSYSDVESLIHLNVDMVGFIFYQRSPRNCSLTSDQIENISFGNTKKVGVFVNEDFEQVINTVHAFKLDFVQLHGNESSDYCDQLQERGIKVIKAFAIHDQFQFNSIEPYHVDLFVFDTKGENAGGNGITFNWDVLRNYKGDTPFLLSGGIGQKHASIDISSVHRQCIGLDVNSKFEISPGKKNIELIKNFKTERACII